MSKQTSRELSVTVGDHLPVISPRSRRRGGTKGGGGATPPRAALWVMVLATTTMVLISSCSSSSAPAGGAGGAGGLTSSNTGGRAGQPASGGQPGSGGQQATGGQTGTGGTSATGGQPGSGGGGEAGQSSGGQSGSAAQGGNTGVAGNAGNAGNGATGGAAGGAGGGGRAGRGGDAGNNNTGGRGGNAPMFAPCPANGATCAIMPLGDSITDGYSTPGGYRIELFRQALTHAKKITFIGRNNNGPASVTVGTTMTPFPHGHEGYTGYTTAPGVGRSGITPLVDSAIAANRPHIVLLMIGTNDVDLMFDLTNAPARLGTLMDKVIADAPDALLVVAKIIPLNDDAGNLRVKTYNDAIPGLVDARVAAGKHMVMVDMNAPFVANANYKAELLADKWHPNPAGYLIMAQTWYKALQSYLP